MGGRGAEYNIKSSSNKEIKRLTKLLSDTKSIYDGVNYWYEQAVKDAMERHPDWNRSLAKKAVNRYYSIENRRTPRSYQAEMKKYTDAIKIYEDRIKNYGG